MPPDAPCLAWCECCRSELDWQMVALEYSDLWNTTRHHIHMYQLTHNTTKPHTVSKSKLHVVKNLTILTKMFSEGIQNSDSFVIDISVARGEIGYDSVYRVTNDLRLWDVSCQWQYDGTHHLESLQIHFSVRVLQTRVETVEHLQQLTTTCNTGPQQLTLFLIEHRKEIKRKASWESMYSRVGKFYMILPLQTAIRSLTLTMLLPTTSGDVSTSSCNWPIPRCLSLQSLEAIRAVITLTSALGMSTGRDFLLLVDE